MTPESGMMFKSIDGRYGMFIKAGGVLVMYYQDPDNFGTYESYNIFDPNKLETPAHWGLDEIYSGLVDNPTAGFNKHLKNRGGLLLWKRQKIKTVKLSSESTAEIKGDVVTVGCQSFPLEKIREIIRVADGEL